VQRPDIAVIGAGIGGRTLGLALRQLGIRAGSACSVVIGEGITQMAPGSQQGLLA
jgi:2-polyprenyl-6-methoxyphenol hydroxylase-like FAD-dependent oxidoreductase